MKDFEKRFEKVFGIKPRLVEGQRCEKGSREIYERLTTKFGSFYSREWIAPELNKELSKIWLRVFFDCEGWCYCKSHQNRHVSLDSVNEKGIIQIQKLLELLGIKSIIKKRNTRDIFTLSIYGKENLVLFQKEIGFLHPDKRMKLDLIINDFMNYSWEFPKEEIKLKKFIIELMKKKAKIKKGNWIVRIISNKKVNLDRLQKELNNLFGIESKINRNISGQGIIYYELNINKQAYVQRVIDLDLLNKEQKQKWMEKK